MPAESSSTGNWADGRYAVRRAGPGGEQRRGGVWSETGSATPMSSRCVTGGAVTDRANTGLIHDCEALLEGRDTLAGIGSLDWSSDAPMTEWLGVTVDGDSMRVTRLDLRDGNLSGRIPAALGR